MPRILLALTLLSSVCLAEGATQPDADLAAQYRFDEATGDALHDGSGSGHDGRIVGAEWTTCLGRPMLRFDGEGDYVDFGDNRELKRSGDFTLMAWVYLDASPYPDGATNWTIVDCEAYREEGFVLRIDGGSSRVMFRTSQKGTEQYCFGRRVLENHQAYLVGVVRAENAATIYVDGRPDASFEVKESVYGAVPFTIGRSSQSFKGCIGEVAIFKRALTNDEVAGWYWREAERYGKDVSLKGKLRVQSFLYYDEQEAVADVDFFGVVPLAKDEKAVVELARRGGAVVASVPAGEISERATNSFAFSLAGLEQGEYELRAVVEGPKRNVSTSEPFVYPPAPPEVPLPEVSVVEPLPVRPALPSCAVRVTSGGGFVLDAAGRSFPVESSFSFPHGGGNRLVCGDSIATGGDEAWRAAAKQVDASTWEVNASGAYYSVVRRIAAREGCVLVSDTITNTTSEPLGILFGNRLNLAENPFKAIYLAGQELGSPALDSALKTCPAAFVSAPDCGVGIVARDDVYIVQSRGSFDGKAVELASKEFALDAGASYTLEWAIHANATGDYYDFVNAIRPAPVTVEGGLACIPGSQQKRDASLVPDKRYFEVRNVAYPTVMCLSWCTDDPAISVEGIEFTEYPKECAQIRAMMERMKEVWPQGKGMFHVAQQLYATNRPEQLFPDSRVLDENGNQTVYPNDYGNGGYFSRERYEANWRWWIYYPTLTNSFGKAMLESVDFMMDELGCRGAFVDGFLWGYGGEYTYDCWDGHTADIDPQTKTITRKKGSVLLLTQDAMVAYCRKVWDKGGVVIANNVIPTRTISSLPLIVDKEVTEGPYTHLVTTPITMGNPGAIQNEVDVYNDVLSKLRWGSLYFYYGEPPDLAHESLPKQMYPITVEEIHSGYVKGRERLVTMHSGVYGWEGNRDLHMAYRYDARGRRIRPGFITTVDADSVRTRIELGENESAVLVRIPVSIQSDTLVNVAVESFDEQELSMVVNGRGKVEVIVPDRSSQAFELVGQQSEVILSLSAERPEEE